ncbi:DUF4926 domain-containing protein [Mycobacterium sp. 155]|uniref:DUF4926 domain-containing protein n=1 Tax=Mycobacterium sp. 155 TaxID=1157943 RepID=UPI00038048E2|nr:DUF4926 domain-containing protein [Mycobacterium sp. 155]
MFRELDPVTLATDVPAEGLTAGARGVIVHVHPGGRDFEVEVFDADGTTVAVATLNEDDLQSRKGQP